MSEKIKVRLLVLGYIVVAFGGIFIGRSSGGSGSGADPRLSQCLYNAGKESSLIYLDKEKVAFLTNEQIKANDVAYEQKKSDCYQKYFPFFQK